MLYATAGAALVATLLAIPALALDQSLFERLFFEGGPIEIASTWGWIVLALLCLVTLRPLTLASVAGSLLCLAAAAREADWHKSFTGYSVMKLGYYFEGDRAIGARAVAFLAMALVVASTIVVVGAVIKRWREADQRPPKWGIAAGVSFAWLAATKVADRFRDVVGDWTGMEFSQTSKRLISAWEEGGEMLLPAAFGATVWIFARSLRHPEHHMGKNTPAARSGVEPRGLEPQKANRPVAGRRA